ncbi:MAG: CehA/McbA family metallohydrolase, partial [Planctomycetia bacterium]|nr:CehA/McbA family metallohydrolase [Planctomycetia bacterium]
PPVEDVAREVRRQGGLLELDKHNWPWSMMLIPTIHVDLYELTNNHVLRTGFRFRTWAEPPPDYMCVERDLKGGVTENGWIDFTLQNYYCLLDCGFRMRPTAGTGTGVHPVPLGYGRVYVHCDGDLTMDHWLRGLDAGQSFVTTGPLMDVRVNGELPGKTFTQEKPEGTFHLTGKLYSQQPLARIEVVMAGEEVRSIAVNTSRASSTASSPWRGSKW